MTTVNGGPQIVTRPFNAQTVSFVVQCPSSTVREAVEALFVDLPEPDTRMHREIVITEEEDGKLSIQLDDGRQYGPRPANAALASLVTAVSRLALDEDVDHLHLHCAALTLEDRGILISAPTGTGKSTLAAALMRNGWAYVSDEAVSLDLDSMTAHGFPKPLMIKPGGGDLVPEVRAARISLEPDDGLWCHVPVGGIGAKIQHQLRPHVIVILYRQPDGTTEKTPTATTLHPVDAVVPLMEQTMDAGRFGADAVVLLSRLAARCLCVSLPVGPLDEASSLLRKLSNQPVTPHDVRELVRVEGTVEGLWTVPEHIVSVAIGERVVIHDTAGGSIVALDDAGSAIWRALHFDAPAWCTEEVMRSASTVEFIRQLASVGLVQSASPEEGYVHG